MDDSKLNTNPSTKDKGNTSISELTEINSEKFVAKVKQIEFDPLTSKVISAIAQNFEDIISANYYSINCQFVRADIFYTNNVLMISIEDYLKRIFYCSKMDLNTLIIALIYIDKMCEENQYVLTLGNIHRIILAGCVLAIQFNEDICYKKEYYAKIGSVNVEMLNNLIFQFFVYMDFRLMIDESFFLKYYNYFTR